MEEYNLLRILFSFGLVLSLIGLLAVGLRWWLRKNPQFSVAQGTGRLHILETKMLDARHKLILIKRDHQEHLLLTSPDHMLLVETLPSLHST